MNYSFKTEIEDIPVIVEGTFEKGEPQTRTDPGIKPAFVIETITIEACDLDDDELTRLEAEAFDKVADEYDDGDGGND